MTPARQLAYDFLKLPYYLRIDLIRKLVPNQMEFREKYPKDNELFQEFFKYLATNNKINELRAAIDRIK